MANFDVMTFTAEGGAKAIVDDLVATSLVRSTGPTRFVTAMEIMPRSTNTGAAMYWGRSTVTTTYGSRMPKGVSKVVEWDGGAINVNDVYMVGDSGGDLADIVFTLA